MPRALGMPQKAIDHFPFHTLYTVLDLLVLALALSRHRPLPVRPSSDFSLHDHSGMQPSDSACATLGHGRI
jgi:hypothetical protein